MIELQKIITAFGIGFLGSIHCVGMCGGISSSLCCGIVHKNSRFIYIYNFLFNLGRVTTYIMLGFIAGFFGFVLLKIIGPDGAWYLRASTGGILILLGLHLFGIKSGIYLIENIGSKLWSKISPLTNYLLPTKSYTQAYAIGVLWGGLPCGLVYSTMAYATAAGDWFESCVLMLCFGLGTMPSMLLTGVILQTTSNFINRFSIRKISGVTVMAFGMWTLIAAYNMKVCCHVH